MSTLVVVKRNGVITIAADTLKVQNAQGTGANHHPNCKIIAVGSTLMGIAGASSAKLAVAEYFGNNEERARFSTVAEIFSSWVALHNALRSDYFLIPTGDEGDSYESSQMDVLLANDSGAYVVSSHRAVSIVLRYHAIGSGEMYAMGALQVLYSQLDLSAEEIAIRAITAAAEFDAHTSLPATVLSVRLAEPQE